MRNTGAQRWGLWYCLLKWAHLKRVSVKLHQTNYTRNVFATEHNSMSSNKSLEKLEKENDMPWPTGVLCVLSVLINMKTIHAFPWLSWKAATTKIGDQLWCVMFNAMLERDILHCDLVTNSSLWFSHGLAKTRCSIICIHSILITQFPMVARVHKVALAEHTFLRKTLFSETKRNMVI